MLKEGSSIEIISEALGHGDVKTTKAYLSSFGVDEISKKADSLLD